MSEDDKGKTVIRPLPGGGFGQRDAVPRPAAGQRTVIGGLPPVTPAFPPGGTHAPPPGVPPSSSGADWTGGVGGGMGAPAGPAQAGDPNSWMGAKPAGQGFFPSAHSTAQAAPAAPTHKISLDAALRAKTTGLSAETNPITAAAAPLLILLGRLRSRIVDMHAVPLMNHVTHEIEEFERSVLQAGVDPHDAQVAKYCLCGTADDIVQNIPGTDRVTWLQYSMVARFFQMRTSGVGFFQEVDKALQNPAQRYHLLELMLTCLQLGFEGQYRGQPGGDVRLAEVKRGIYEALRRVRARGDDDISPAWQGVELAARRRFGGTPVWVVALLAAGVVTAAYFGMRLLLVDEGNRLETRMTTLHPTDQILLFRSPDTPVAPALPFVADTTQIERITAALAGEAVTVSGKGEFILINVNNIVLFDSGKAEVRAAFAALATKIAAALNAEPGQVFVIGHTDSVPPSGRGRYKTNFDLSVARATAVAAALKPGFADPARLVIEGKGDLEPIADNKTPEGRADNRRVQIMIQREDTL